MNHQKNRLAVLLALTGSFSCAISGWAQNVTTDTYLDNVTPTALYAAWATPLSVGTTPTGLEIVAQTAYGSLYYAVPAGQQQVLDPSDNQATLTLTFNNPSSPPGAIGGQYWFGIPFILDDPSSTTTFGGYTGEFTSYNPTASPGSAVWNGNTVTETVPLSGALLSNIQAGGDSITGFNLEFAPAIDPDGFTDITFNSLVLSSTVPEPSTWLLVASGGAALWMRRKK